MSHLGLTTPQSLSLCTLTRSEFRINFHLLHKEDSLMRVERVTNLWYKDKNFGDSL